MDLTTTARVKAFGRSTHADDDTLIDSLVTSVSARVASLLARHVEATARTEVYQLPIYQRTVSLRGYPTSAVTAVKYTNDGQWSLVDALETDAYSFDPDTGELRLYILTEQSRGEVQVAYTGGMGATQAAFTTAYPDISGSIDAHIWNMLKRSINPGGKTTFVGGAIESERELGDLRMIEEVIALHRRII